MNQQQKILSGIVFAVAACIIWSGNFIVARAFISQVPPVTMSLFRWTVATIVLFPFAWKSLHAEWKTILQHKQYFFWTALFGVTIFNTFLYLAAHSTTAINMALIGTCSSPIFAVFLAAFFLGERVTWVRITGMSVMLAGILFLLVKGSWAQLTHFHFSSGDIWVLSAALFFAAYNILVRRKPAGVSPLAFLFTVFFTGTVLLVPFYIREQQYTLPIQWTAPLIGTVFYLGIGTSVIAFLLWNVAIARLGAARTALFGNLIPLFSSIEAVLFLNETVNAFHYVSGLLIIIGLVIANMKKK